MMNLLQKYTFLIVMLILIVPLSSCRPEPVASEDAMIIVLQPSAEATITSDSVIVRTYIENFTLADKAGQDNQAGEGHLVFYLDAAPPTVAGVSALTSEGTYYISTEKAYTWENVSPGQHSFWVQLVNNDNTSLEPPAAVRVPVTVSGR
jgi:hypothetical protein